ncbi:hypothetical protein UlMin_006495 [Ulmus minor]
MSISIEARQVSEATHEIFDVEINSDSVETLVTHIPSMVDDWIQEIERINNHNLNNLIVGLDVEWRPSFNRYITNKVAVLQLCVGHRCLIFQPLHAQFIPQSLSEFLGNSNYSFVGVGIQEDIEKLACDWELSVRNPVDVRDLAANSYSDSNLRNTSLKNLAKTVLGLEIEKPRRITMGRWDKEWLDTDQVKYACVDAFVSSELGKRLV